VLTLQPSSHRYTPAIPNVEAITQLRPLVEALGKGLYARVSAWPSVGGFITVHDLWAQLHVLMSGVRPQLAFPTTTPSPAVGWPFPHPDLGCPCTCRWARPRPSRPLWTWWCRC
jgi:hypothetical protein